MGYVTKEQIERARKFLVLDYVLRYEANEYKRVGRGYRLIEDNAFAVDDKGWYCHKRQIGSRTALDYLVEIKGYSLVEAVCSLLGERSHEHGDRPNTDTSANTITPKARSPTQSKKPPIEERAPFAPPLRNKDNKRVLAYLQSRGIDRDLILDCINQGSLYESAQWHNCVFTGRDENGKTKFAAIRSTTTRFLRDADGSDKKYGFTLPPENPNSREIAVFESPIDALSHQTLCKQGFIPPFDGWRISLGGTSVTALEHFTEQCHEVTHCLVCTDNDEAGEAAAAKIKEMQGISSERSPPIYGKDCNDMLQAMQKAERLQNRTISTKQTERG